MQAGTYSVRIVPRQRRHGRIQQPSPKTEVTITANQFVRSYVPRDGHDQRTGRLGCVRDNVYQRRHSRPWYLYGTITTAQVSSAGGNVDIEWNDDVTANQQLEFDNDPPPDAQYLASLAGCLS